MKRLAIIPARCGSKGLKDKNIALLGGKPLMAYSIEAALKSHLFSRVVVTTDSAHYAEIAHEWGAEVMMREQALSNDRTSMYEVVADVLQRAGEAFDSFTLLQPTSPLRSARHISEALSLFESGLDHFDFLVSVKEAEHIKALVNPLDADGSLGHFDADFSDYRRQSGKDYTPNGAIFIAKPEAYLTQKHFFGPRSRAYIMAPVDSVDIDSRLDLTLARAILHTAI